MRKVIDVIFTGLEETKGILFNNTMTGLKNGRKIQVSIKVNMNFG